jgi:hypothetical protein
MTNEVIRAGLCKAARDPWNLVMLGLGSAGGALIDCWPFVGLATFGYLVSIGLDLTRQRFWQKVLEDERRCSPPLPDLETVADGESTMLLQRVHDVARRLERVRPPRGPVSGELREGIVALEREAVQLLGALQEVNRFLGEHPLIAAEREAELRERQVAAGADEPVQHERRWHLRVAQQMLADLRGAEADRRRLASRLQATVATLETLACRLARPVVPSEFHEDEPRRDLLGDAPTEAAASHPGALATAARSRWTG